MAPPTRRDLPAGTSLTAGCFEHRQGDVLARPEQSTTGEAELPSVRAIAAVASPPQNQREADADFADALRVLAAHNATAGGRAAPNFRDIARHLPIVVFGVDAAGLMTECFGGGLERLGVGDDDLVGIPAASFGDAAADWSHRVLAGEAATMIIEGDGAKGPFMFHVVAAPLPDGDSFLAVAIDITSQHEAERDARNEGMLHRTAIAALKGSEARFETVSEHVPIGVFLADPDGVLTYANPELLRILERDWDSLREMHSLHGVIHPDDLAEASVALATGERSAVSRIFEGRIVRGNGAAVSVRIRMVTLYDDGPDGAPSGMVGSVADITDFVAADARLREREERTRAILETAGEAIVSCGEDNKIIEFNAAAERMFGYDSEDVIGRLEWPELIPQPQRNYLVQHLQDYVNGAPAKFVGQGAFEIPGLRSDGTHVPMEVAITEVQASAERIFTVVMRDLTERKVLERELERRSTHDDLTGLPNRVLLFGQLEAALSRANRHDSSVAVLFVDVDRFKLVTESLGHRAGDELIVQVARRLEGAVSAAAAITRFSDDQFVMYLEDINDISDAVDVAVAVVESINDPFEVAGDEAFVGATVGIAFAPNGVGTAETLVSNADVAMSRAKEHSVTRYEVFDAEMRARVDSQRRLEIAMRHGIERGEFELHYQPIVWLGTGQPRGVEALVRWNHPRLGFLPPGEFIPVAEDSGLILPLGQWIIEEACRQQASWARRFPKQPLMMSLNLSGRQLTQPGLAEIVRSAIETTGADPHMIVCEITETMLLHDVETAGATLHELKSIGVRVALDDFGTGYSSLTYLCRFPIDIVKVDRSFVSQLGTATPDATIVEMVVNLARTMQLDVVAEGVETERQQRLLKAIGCPLGQGYLFAKPCSAADLERAIMAVSDHDLSKDVDLCGEGDLSEEIDLSADASDLLDSFNEGAAFFDEVVGFGDDD